MPITTVEQLRDHLELAIQVELSTIPPYLYAMYSIEDQQSDAVLLIRSIVAEEMLHAALCTNVLLAVGGTPDFASEAYIPRYPLDLPHHIPPLRLDLAPASEDLIRRVLMRIEQPETHGAPDQPDQYETLGQFYHALENGVKELAASTELFTNPQRSAQMGDPDFYRPVALDAEDSGGLVLVDDLDSAVEAFEIIVHQGEGLSDERWADPSHQELTHYSKLVQIADGDSPLGAVRPVRTNPTTASFPEDIRIVADLFNAAYRGMYLTMRRLFGDEGLQRKAVGVLYILMVDIMSPLAHWLVQQTLDDGTVASPTFEIYAFRGSDRLKEMEEMAQSAAEMHEELSPVYETIRALEFIL